jgi:1,4-dihydroxy-2-naphthoate octaprenyltransferase
MTSIDAVAPGSARAWFLATRPPTLAAALVPVAVGTAVASRAGEVRWLAALAALVGACLIQIGTNFANDAFDFEKGADDGARLGPARAAQSGWLTASDLKRGMAVVFGLAVLVGLYLTWVGGPAILGIGVVSILAGIAYTGGPFPLAYNGLGDAFVLVFFGFVAVMGTAWVAGGSIPDVAALASVPVGALATAILVVNNVRDREGDERVGKRTLIVRFGRRFGQAEYLVVLALAYVMPVVLFARGMVGPFGLLPCVTLPLAFPLVASILRDEGAILNRTLVGTARLLVLHGLSFAIGLAVDG